MTARFLLLLGLGAAALAAALAARQPALAGAGAALLAAPASAAALHRWPRLEFDVALSPRRVVEGDELELVVTVAADCDVPWLDVEVELPSGLASVDGVTRQVVRVPAGGARAVRFPVRPAGWGVLAPGRVQLVARDRFGLFSASVIQTPRTAVRVYPSEVRLDALAPTERTTRTLGVHLSRDRGEGCEYADVRPHQQGDRLRAVNWRVSRRRGQLWVNDRHPERSADVVLLVDDTAELGEGADTTLRRALRAAMTLAEGHLGVADRVGLAALGAPLRWIRPRAGKAQWYALVDLLLECQEVRLGLAPPAELLARARLAPGATVLALTSLGQPRVVEALAELRRRGHRVVVVESEPPPAAAASPPELLARRIFALDQAQLRARLAELGVPCVRWDGDTPLDVVLEGLRRAPALR